MGRTPRACRSTLIAWPSVGRRASKTSKGPDTQTVGRDVTATRHPQWARQDVGTATTDHQRVQSFNGTGPVVPVNVCDPEPSGRVGAGEVPKIGCPFGDSDVAGVLDEAPELGIGDGVL